MELNRKQREYVAGRAHFHMEKVDEIMAGLEERRKMRPHHCLADRLAWETEHLMEHDLLRAWWTNVLIQADDSKNTQTLEGLRDHYLRRLRDTRPPRSGGDEGHRVLERAEHAALTAFLDELDGGSLGTGLLGMTDEPG